MLRGRTTERVAIDALLRGVCGGQGGGVVVHGEPGIGARGGEVAP